MTSSPSHHPDWHAACRAGETAASSPGAGAVHLDTGLDVLRSAARADLHEMLARGAVELSRVRAQSETTTITAETARDKARHVADMHGDATSTLQKPAAPDDTSQRGTGALSRLGRLVLVVGAAALGAVVNTAPFLPLFDLPLWLTSLVVLGFELLLILAGHSLGRAAKRDAVAAETGAAGGRRSVASLSRVALAVTVLALAAIRGYQLVHEADLPPLVTLPASLFFAGIGCLLVVVSYELGWDGEARGTSRGIGHKRKTRQSSRSMTRAATEAERRARDAARAASACEAERKRLRHNYEARRELWNACLSAYFQGYRGRAPVELLRELDAVKVGEVATIAIEEDA